MTTAVTIAPSKLSNVMDLPSQAGAGVQIERRDGKGRHAYGNKDKVENEAEHWRSFPARRRSCPRVLLARREFLDNRFLIRQKML
jgi:hypothetical protein